MAQEKRQACLHSSHRVSNINKTIQNRARRSLEVAQKGHYLNYLS
jgi:hypothetical protein